jgi:hypothetical protein
MMSGMILLYSIASFVTSPYIVWFPVVMAGALAIAAIIAMVYMLSSSMGREDIRVQAKMKLYEIAISMVIIFAFLAIATLVTTQNFEIPLAQAGLVPSGCVNAVDMFSLAVCNLHEFNNNVLNLTSLTYWAGVSFSFVPELKFNGTMLFTIPDFGPMAKLPLMPTANDTFIGYLLPILYGAFMLSQVELLLLEASLILFSLFMAIGLIARIFVVTRSFGGSMIALAVGLGIIYPLLACITYGYVNVGMEANNSIFTGLGGYEPYLIIIGLTAASMSAVLTILPAIVVGIFGLGSFLSNSGWVVSLIFYIGLAAAGLFLIPFINFMIIDVFVIDFSKAIGEKIDFMTLLTGLV